ncbi:DNA mismatch repair protein, partial [Tanacetum coccineum]
KMRTLKGYVKNTACPEGCITKRSLDNECLNFCSMYLNDVETNFNKVERNNEMVDIDGDISVFSCKDYTYIYTYILHNCDEMVELINEHKLKLEKEKCNNINELRDKHFASWLQERVNNCPESFESEIRLLSRGPLSVNEYSGCMVNGVSDVRGLQVDKESAAISINMSREWFIDQPYILASQAKQEKLLQLLKTEAYASAFLDCKKHIVHMCAFLDSRGLANGHPISSQEDESS